MEKDEMKPLHDDVMEQVSGGTWVENKELVALYNKYNPEDPLTDYDDKIEKWARRLWDAPDNAEWRPIILKNDDYHFNSYILPGMGFVSHETFLRVTDEKARSRQ